MSTFTVSGLSSGIDTESLIQQLLQIERIPLNRLEEKKTAAEQKQAAYTDLASKIEALESAADKLRASSGFQDRTASVSNDTILTATPGSSASSGSMSLVVSQLALVHRLISGAGLSGSTATVASGSGQFTFKVGESGTEYTVDVDADMTLEELKNAINSLDAGVTAAILDEGTGETPYRLVLSTEETGADQKIIVTRDDTNLGFPVNDTSLSSDLHIQRPQDARIEIGNLSVYRSSNTVTDLMPGVTLYLHKADPTESVTVTVDRDVETIRSKIEDLIDAYNDVVNFVNARSNYDTKNHKGDPLWGETTVRSLMRRLGQIVSSRVEGLPEDMRSLAQLGVSTQRDGTLQLDTAKLQKALEENFQGVMDLFLKGDSTSGVAEQFYQVAYGATRTGEGELSVRSDGLQSQIRSLDAQISDQEAYLDRYEARLQAQFASLESLLASFQSQDQYFLQKLS